MNNEEERLRPRAVAASVVHDQVYKAFPNDLNQHKTVFGGLIMSLMDRVASIVAERHSDSVCVTVGVDAVHFLAPAIDGDTLIFHASLNRAWNTSMEIGVRVEAERVGEPGRRHILSAYLTFVAMDAARKPRRVPPAVPQSPDELRRYEEAELRRASRLAHTEAIKRLRKR